MGEFLKGWRRKVGCVTLVMALAFTMGWVRSVSVSEGAVIQFPAWTHFLISTGGHFSWMANFPASDRPVEETVDHSFVYAEIEWKWRCRWHGIDIGEGHLMGFPLKAWVIPYWSIVIPLTLLSAYLLLSKPHNSTPKKITEPTASEGGATS